MVRNQVLRPISGLPKTTPEKTASACGGKRGPAFTAKIPVVPCSGKYQEQKWWARLGSNQRPLRCQGWFNRRNQQEIAGICDNKGHLGGLLVQDSGSMNRFCTNDPYVRRVDYSRCRLSTELCPLRPQEQTWTQTPRMTAVDPTRTFFCICDCENFRSQIGGVGIRKNAKWEISV